MAGNVDMSDIMDVRDDIGLRADCRRSRPGVLPQQLRSSRVLGSPAVLVALAALELGSGGASSHVTS